MCFLSYSILQHYLLVHLVKSLMPFFDVSTFDDNDANIEEGMKCRFLVNWYPILIKEILISDEKIFSALS